MPEPKLTPSENFKIKKMEASCVFREFIWFWCFGITQKSYFVVMRLSDKRELLIHVHEFLTNYLFKFSN